MLVEKVLTTNWTFHFSLFTLKDDTEATKKFSAYSHQLAPLYLSSRKVLDEELLNQICKWIRDNPTWTSAHLAAKAELQESFKQNGILEWVTFHFQTLAQKFKFLVLLGMLYSRQITFHKQILDRH